MTIQLDILQTLAIAVIVLWVGKKLRHVFKILEKLCISSPVVGGLDVKVLLKYGKRAIQLVFGIHPLLGLCTGSASRRAAADQTTDVVESEVSLSG